MSKNNIHKLKATVYLMIVLGIITFLSGFLKYTPFEHLTILLLFLLSLGGVKLLYGSRNAELNTVSKFFLILTGLSSLGFMFLIVVALFKTLFVGLTLSDNIELLESLFYLISLIFLIGVIGCIIFLNIRGGRKSTHS